MERHFIRVGDKTSVGGTVAEGLGSHRIEGAEVSFNGAKIVCPACKSTGTLKCIGPRLPFPLSNGQQVALEDDLCICGCRKPPRLLASQSCSKMRMDGEQLRQMGFSPAGSALPETEYPHAFDQHFSLVDELTGEPLANRFYRIKWSGGVVEGRTDQDGRTKKVSAGNPEEATIEIFGEAA